ncbi:MAG: AzlC family ABC transporter permease [Thermoleophilia bacterium]
MRSVRQDKAVVRQAGAIAVVAGAFALSFGVLCSETGLGLPMTVALSTLVFAGSAQLAAVGVIADGGTGAAAVLAGLLLSARNLAFGVALAPLLGGRLGRRLLASQLVIDESVAVATAQPDPVSARRAFWITGLGVFLPWNAGTVAGWLLTDAIDVEATGLDAAIPGAFVALLAPRLTSRAAWTSALCGAGIALALTPVTAPGVPILLSAAGALAGLVVQARADRS